MYIYIYKYLNIYVNHCGWHCSFCCFVRLRALSYVSRDKSSLLHLYMRLRAHVRVQSWLLVGQVIRFRQPPLMGRPLFLYCVHHLLPSRMSALRHGSHNKRKDRSVINQSQQAWAKCEHVRALMRSSEAETSAPALTHILVCTRNTHAHVEKHCNPYLNHDGHMGRCIKNLLWWDQQSRTCDLGSQERHCTTHPNRVRFESVAANPNPCRAGGFLKSTAWVYFHVYIHIHTDTHPIYTYMHM